jgi:hypothetical protein
MEKVNAVRAFYEAACKLAEEWEKNGGVVNDCYPFAEDFDEVVAKLGKWAEAQTAEGGR